MLLSYCSRTILHSVQLARLIKRIAAMASSGSLPSTSLPTGAAVRSAARSGHLTTHTSGFAPTYLQANLIVLPSRYAADFRTLCPFTSVFYLHFSA